MPKDVAVVRVEVGFLQRGRDVANLTNYLQHQHFVICRYSPTLFFQYLQNKLFTENTSFFFPLILNIMHFKNNLISFRKIQASDLMMDWRYSLQIRSTFSIPFHRFLEEESYGESNAQYRKPLHVIRETLKQSKHAYPLQ